MAAVSQPSHQRQLILITGPARSGKSEWAEQQALQSQKPVTYIATAQHIAGDRDWQQRIQRHQERRPTAWQTQEVPLHLAAAIRQAHPNHCLLVDSLGTWLANCIEFEECRWQQQADELVESLHQSPCDIIVVSEETGWGVVPAYELGRRFRDRLGSLSRQIGAVATHVYLVTGGYAIDLRQFGTPLPQV